MTTSLVVVTLVAFAFGFFGSMPVAGPIAVMVVSRSAERRFHDAMRLACGAAAAEAFWAFLAFWGFATFAARYSAVLPISHAVTALVLVFVGARFLRWKPKPCRSGAIRRGRSPFMLGFGVSLLNPTLAVTWSAVTTALYSRGFVSMNAWFSVAFGLAAGAGVAAWFALIVKLMRRWGKRFPESAMKWMLRGMGLLLILVGLWAGVDLVRDLVR